MVMFSITELLTHEEIVLMLKLYEEHHGDGQFATLCRQQIVEPNLQRFNELTRQENDACFLAYLLESTLVAVEAGRRKGTAA